VSSSIEADPPVGQTQGGRRVHAGRASQSRRRRAWRRFRRNRLGFSAWCCSARWWCLSLFAELLSNDKPLLVRYNGQFYFPMVQGLPGDHLRRRLRNGDRLPRPVHPREAGEGRQLGAVPPNPYGPNTINYFAKEPNPGPPSRDNWLGTDDRGRDLLAQLIYGFRLSVLFGLALTAIGVLLGVITGAIQGFFGGKHRPGLPALHRDLGARCRSCTC
jgi:microcin C transport system permease protein